MFGLSSQTPEIKEVCKIHCFEIVSSRLPKESKLRNFCSNVKTLNKTKSNDL